jgi:hypothetical protein
MTQCIALTLNNTRCSRNAIPGSKYCKQHSKIYESEKYNEEKQLIPPKTLISLHSLHSIPSIKPITIQTSSKTISNLGITSPDLIKHFSSQKIDTYKNTQLKELTIFNEQKLLDTELLECKDVKAVNVDGKSLYKILHHHIFDYNDLKGVLCATSTFLKSSSLMQTSIKIHKWISKLKFIGKGINGYVFNPEIDHQDNIFAMKVNQNKKYTSDLIHELIVGLFGTNKLRQYIPNFSYIFAGFQCGGIEMKDNKIKSYCNDKDTFQYILYEFIKGLSFSDIIKNISIEGFLDLFLQILFSLQIAYEKIDFTHYDLHNGNIIIRTPFNHDFYIPYKTNNTTYYIKTNKIATIIDYGYSHIKYNDNNYGIYNYPEYDVKGEKSFPLYDVYKLLMFSMLLTIDKNKEVYIACTKIFKYFSDEDPKVALKKQNDDKQFLLYNLPAIDKYTKIQPIEIINYIMEIFTIDNILYTKLKVGDKVLTMNEHEFDVIVK